MARKGSNKGRRCGPRRPSTFSGCSVGGAVADQSADAADPLAIPALRNLDPLQLRVISDGFLGKPEHERRYLGLHDCIVGQVVEMSDDFEGVRIVVHLGILASDADLRNLDSPVSHDGENYALTT